MTLREKRLRETTNALTRTVAQRDGCLANLVRYETRIKTLRKQVQRLEKVMAAEPKPVPKSELVPVPYTPGASLAAKIDDALNGGDGLEIPGFLQRKKATDTKDAEAAAAIRQEQADRKANKARVRIETMKAKQRGDTKRMPLTGREALAAIRG